MSEKASQIATQFDPNSVKRVRFGDFPIVCTTRSELVAWALQDCAAGAGEAKLVFDANGHALSLARIDRGFKQSIHAADIVHADGGFLVTLSRLLKLNAIPERSATTDMLHDFADAFRGTGRGFFLLGGDERVNKQCSEILTSSYPNLEISGRRHGFFSAEEERGLVDVINRSGADILWVGLGKPKEQDFCIRWRASLKVKWIITCGGCFNYVTGDYPRAPEWMQKLNIEWLHRMSTRPRALFGRYFLTTPHALWIALSDHGDI